VLPAPLEYDATRPHVLLAGMRSRPQKPAHARTPPSRVDRPRSPEPVERPYALEPSERVERTRVPVPLERRRAHVTTA
jgi:hypothetical protein